jgi:5-methylcytosine-specific restriction endonuclease McrA
MSATLHKEFMSRSSSIYGGMAKRFAEKRNKLNRITRVGRPLPFTVEEFRVWLRLRLGGEDGKIRCPYCSQWLLITTIAVDHLQPIARGGTLALDNLGLPCQPCNARKGKLTPDEYKTLYDALQKWPAAAAQDVLHRLEIAVQLAAQRRFTITKDARKSAEEHDAF